MAYPFMPMTNEILEKLTRVIKDSEQTIKSPELPAVFENQEIKSILELNAKSSKTNQSDIRTDNHS